MASGDILIIPAQAAGFYSFQGNFAKNASADTIDIPAGMINIGGNSKGYLLAAVTGFNPYLAANSDSSFTAITLGDDIYLYACQQASGYAKIVCSKNATAPTGYTSSNSRKISGFHVGRTRPIANRFDAAYVPLVGIVPNSVWDLGHRPKCSPEGMAEIQPRLWGMIYLPSVISGTWPSVVFGSRFNVSPVRSTGGYNQLDIHRGIHAAGMREPTFEEWLMMADGAPQGVDATNDTAWAMTTNTGPCNTGAVAKSVSCSNFVDTVGNLWETLSGQFDIGNSTNAYAWDATVVNTGQDTAYPRGQVYHVAWRGAVAGGSWTEGVHGGARALHTNSGAWVANGAVTTRGVSDSL
ncbi:MAG: hypothetical protein HHJ15_18205 [Rhodoferax sp.]|uniref:phage major tropism determinant n=1 Tax=Rhodoferax sp. TaxID=50421 RepID=UPI0018594F40|nr:hypothetical protein [Rhodoferax sp.]NMM21856.1 hypothetical protein [Rhodoferax sp.]